MILSEHPGFVDGTSPAFHLVRAGDEDADGFIHRRPGARARQEEPAANDGERDKDESDQPGPVRGFLLHVDNSTCSVGPPLKRTMRPPTANGLTGESSAGGFTCSG